MPFTVADLPTLGWLVYPFLLAAIIGNACLWTAWLNFFYGCPFNKIFLKLWRLLCAAIIAGVPVAIVAGLILVERDVTLAIAAYLSLCAFLGAVVFPVITLLRWIRPRPPGLLAESTTTTDYWPILGKECIGDGYYTWAMHLPGNCVLRMDVTEMVLAPAGLPVAWDGMTILLLTDLHLHGTPSRAYFDRLFADIAALGPHDLLLLAGDYVDTDEHRSWLVPLLTQLKWREQAVAILGNHDQFYEPDLIREELQKAGCLVLGNHWQEVVIRGERCVFVGHEGPWFRPPPDLAGAPAEPFRICISHSPDNFYWGLKERIGLMLCGHVHGGGVRVPVVGSIHVPSVYGRRFDMGVFEKAGQMMVVSRGMSGKEPLRFQCHPQVIRITLKQRPAEQS